MADDKKPVVKAEIRHMAHTDGRGPARVCKESDRAEPGLRRYRVRALGSGPTGSGAVKKLPRYVLAPDRASAEACYLESEAGDLAAAGFDGEKKKPVLQVDELPD